MTITGDIFARACALQELNRYDEALTLLGDALATAPDDSRLHAARSVCLHQLERYDEALDAADAAIAADPALVDGHLGRAWAMLEMVDGAEQALESAMEALQLAPFAEAALEVVAHALLACGDDNSAEQVAGTMLTSNPGSLEAHTLLGAVAIAREQWDLAHEHLTTALGLAPNAPHLMLNLAAVSRQAGRATEEVEWYRRVAATTPHGDGARRVARAMVNSAETLFFAGRPPGEAVAELARETDSGDPARPPFVTAMLRAILARRLLVWHEGDSAANVLRAVELLERQAAVEPDPAVPPPAGGLQGRSADLARDLQAAAWVGGAGFRRMLQVDWLDDAAEGNLLAVPVAGDRQARVARCLAMVEASLERAAGEPFATARLHMVAGRAEAMRADGDREENTRRAVAHFASALEIYVRLRSIGQRSEAETFLADALLSLDPDEDGEPIEQALGLLRSAQAARRDEGALHALAILAACIGEAHMKRLQVLGTPADCAAALEHLVEAATMLGEFGQYVGQAHFLAFAARCHLMRPGGGQEDLARATELLRAAAGLVSRETAPIRWAMVQGELAEVLRRDTGPAAVESRAAAVGHARFADGVATPDGDPRDWAVNRLALARALAARAEVDPSTAADDLTEALVLLREVAPVLAARCSRPDQAEAHIDAAAVCRLAAHALDDPALLSTAEEHLTAAREIAESRRYTRILDLLTAEHARVLVARGEPAAVTEATGA